MGLVAAGGVPLATLGTAANAGLASWLVTLPGLVGTSWVTEGDRVLLVASVGVPGVPWGLYGAEVLLEVVELGAVTVLGLAVVIPAAGLVALVLGVTEDATTTRVVSPSTGGDTFTSGSTVLWPRTGDGAVTSSGAVGDTVPAPAAGFWLPGDTAVALMVPGSAPPATGVGRVGGSPTALSPEVPRDVSVRTAG